MAASRKSKFSDRLEVQDRFRINLESIINKYDKPFEDSPILDLQKMSSVSESLQDLKFFRPFGRTPLATDLQKGKKRKGGVSCDSALGSTISPSKSSELTGDSSGNIQLQDYDFTHETSDSLGAFIRYKHHSMSKNPQIVGLERDEGESDESCESDDDLGSVCSGPTYAPYSQEKYKENNEGDLTEVDRASQSDNIPDDDINMEERSSEDKVRSWLSDDAFLTTSRHSNIDDEDSEGDEMEKLNQDSEYPSTLSEGEEDKGKSLLEIKERFVRRVKSMLVEGNNETDDISSSADETTSLSQRVPGEGQNTPRTADIRNGQSNRPSHPDAECDTMGHTYRMQFKEPLSSTICQETCRDTPVMLMGDETTIIAGHFDDDSIISPECEDEDKARTSEATVQKGFELVQSPGGKMEWTSFLCRKSAVNKTVPLPHVMNKVESPDSNQPSSALTPKKVILASGMTERTFKTPQGKSNLPFKSHVSKTTTENLESSQDIISEIMDFFKSPLPELLTSPMPILSPKGRRRTAQGKPVRRAVPITDTRQTPGVNVQGSSPFKSWQCESSMESKQPASTGSTINSEQSSHNSIMCAEMAVIDQKSSKQTDDSLNHTQVPHGVQEILGELPSVEQSMSTEEDGDISLLTEDSSEESTTFQNQSRSRTGSVFQSPKTQTKLCQSTNKLVKIPKTPTQVSIPSNELEKVSKTPSITSPFSHMCVNSAGKDRSKVRNGQEKRFFKARTLPHPSKNLDFGEKDLADSRDGIEKKPDIEFLVISSSDDDGDYDELGYPIEKDAMMHRVRKIKGGDISHDIRSNKPWQNENTGNISPGNSLDDKCSAKEKQSSIHKGNVAYDSEEKLTSDCKEETWAHFQGHDKISEFEQTYILSERGERILIPHHMSISRCKIDTNRQQNKKKEHRSSSYTIQSKLSNTKKDESKSNEPKHKYSRSLKVREDSSSSTKNNITRTTSIRSHDTAPVMTNEDDDDPLERHEEKLTPTLRWNGCSTNRLHRDKEKMSKTNDRKSNYHEVRTSYKHSYSGRVSDRRDFTVESNLGSNSDIPTRREDRTYVVNGDSNSQRTEDNSSSVSPGIKSRLVRSNFVTSDKMETKCKQRLLAKTANVNDSSGSSDVRLKSSRLQKLLNQQEAVCSGQGGNRLHGRDVSFLSSTRIEEEKLNSKEFSRLLSENHSADERLAKRVPCTYEEATQEKPFEMKTETPSKRRRHGSDKINSLDSPTKRQVNARRSSPRGRKILNRSKGSRRVLDINEEDERWKDSLSLSTVCDGPGRCTKKICFKCAMNE